MGTHSPSCGRGLFRLLYRSGWGSVNRQEIGRAQGWGIRRRSVDGIIDESLFDNSEEGCTYTTFFFSLRTLPPEGDRVSSVRLGMSGGAGAILFNL